MCDCAAVSMFVIIVVCFLFSHSNNENTRGRDTPEKDPLFIQSLPDRRYKPTNYFIGGSLTAYTTV